MRLERRKTSFTIQVGKLYIEAGWFSGEAYKLFRIELLVGGVIMLTILDISFLKFGLCVFIDLYG